MDAVDKIEEGARLLEQGVYEVAVTSRSAGPAGGTESPITTDGKGDPERIKYGTASWVYGEELDQTTAIWWSPDSRKVAYYRFDESQVPDYVLQIDSDGQCDPHHHEERHCCPSSHSHRRSPS